MVFVLVPVPVVGVGSYAVKLALAADAGQSVRIL